MIEQGRSGKRAETAGAVLHIGDRYFIILDVIFLCTITAIALMLRVDAYPSIVSFALAVALYAAIALVIRLTVFYRFELYRRYWRYASVEEYRSTAGSVCPLIEPYVCGSRTNCAGDSGQRAASAGAGSLKATNRRCA
jgi:hypothetical protein